MRNRLSCLVIFVFGCTLSENCYISSKNSKRSWIVTIRKNINPNINQMICVGLMLSHTDIIIPSKCLSRQRSKDFYTGRELKAISGVEKGSCTQTKAGINVVSSISPTLLNNVAILQVENFVLDRAFEPGRELFNKMPQTGRELKRYWHKLLDRNVPLEKRPTCELLVFEPEKPTVNQPKLLHLVPQEKRWCKQQLCGELYNKKPPPCPETMWSKDNFACLMIYPALTTCKEFNMGSPIICNSSMICGILKSCIFDQHNFGIVIMQMITVEHLDALAQSATIVKQPVLKSLGKELGEVISIEFSPYIEHLYVTVHIENKFTIRSLNDDAPMHEIYTDFTLIGAHWSSAQGNIVFGWGGAPHLAVYHVQSARRMALICPEGDHPSSPHVLATAVNHKSPRLMAVGGSNGCVFVWEIPQYFRTPYD